MKQPRQRRAAETRVRILDAAERLFDERGYARASMTALAEAADVSVGGLYEWFAGKEEVLTALAARHVAAAGGAILARLGEAGPQGAAGAIRLVLETAFEIHRARPRLHHFLYTEAPRPPALQEKLAAFNAGLEGALAARLPGEDQRAAQAKAALIVRAGESLLHEYVLDADLPGSPEDRLEEVVRRLCDWAET